MRKKLHRFELGHTMRFSLVDMVQCQTLPFAKCRSASRFIILLPDIFFSDLRYSCFRFCRAWFVRHFFFFFGTVVCIAATVSTLLSVSDILATFGRLRYSYVCGTWNARLVFRRWWQISVVQVRLSLEFTSISFYGVMGI